jgi:hypothetical protein
LPNRRGLDDEKQEAIDLENARAITEPSDQSGTTENFARGNLWLENKKASNEQREGEKLSALKVIEALKSLEVQKIAEAKIVSVETVAVVNEIEAVEVTPVIEVLDIGRNMKASRKFTNKQSR